MMRFAKLAAAGLLAAATFSGAALAAGGEAKPLKHHHWSWQGVFGGYERDQLQRGYQVYRSVCANCHSMNLVAFRHLAQPGGPYEPAVCDNYEGLPEGVDCSVPTNNPIIKSLAADFQVTDGPDDTGEMFQRPGLPSDYFPAPYANRQQSMAANGGAYPPDMSLLVKARHHGESYIYSLITGYPDENPVAIEVPPGQYYNPYYPGDTTGLLKEEYLDEEGHPLKERIKADVDPALVSESGIVYGGAFKMAKPLSDGAVPYEDGSPETVEQYAEDVVAFLAWAAEPKLEQRKSMGRFVMLYLFIFAGVLYASYRVIWSRVH